MKKIIQVIKKLKTLRLNRTYTKFYEKLKINQNVVLGQSYAGSNFSGNVYYLVDEICKKNENLKIFIGVNKKEYKKIKKYVKKYVNSQFHVLKIGSKQYLKVLASAKYLINNVAFPTYFIKKNGQKYLNTWHGTPLKGLGRSIKDAPYESGNYQRNFLFSDYLLYPNDYTFQRMRKDYMIEEFFRGKYILNGYPRNDILCYNEQREQMRKKYGMEGKEIIVYMPTWRRSKRDVLQDNQLLEFLEFIDLHLQSNQVLYVKLHNLVKDKIDFSNFKHIKPYIESLETYIFLSLSDALITDYSSVMFDYMNTNKKIILYPYDYEEYMSDRSVYFDLHNLPFPFCMTKEEVLIELSNLNRFPSYEKEKQFFCPYDHKDSTKELVSLFLDDQSGHINIMDGSSFSHSKPGKKVLIYSGALKTGLLTYNLMKYLNKYQNDQNYYFLNFYNHKVKSSKKLLNVLPHNISYITFQGPKDVLYKEWISYQLYYRFGIYNRWIASNINSLFLREEKRLLPNMKFDIVIQYMGTNITFLHLYALQDVKKYIFIHTQKIQSKKIARAYQLLLRQYDRVFVNNNAMKKQLSNKFQKEATLYFDDQRKFTEIFSQIMNEK